MFRYYFVFSSFFFSITLTHAATATMEYQQCLATAVNHGNWLFNKKRLAPSTKVCIRDGISQARNKSKQYSQDIKPLMKEHYASVKQCKKDNTCNGVSEKKITYTTFFEKNCNRPKIKYYHTCDMDRTLRGLKKG